MLSCGAVHVAPERQGDYCNASNESHAFDYRARQEASASRSMGGSLPEIVAVCRASHAKYPRRVLAIRSMMEVEA
jgi:hypothetical protein